MLRKGREKEEEEEKHQTEMSAMATCSYSTDITE